MSKNNLKIIIQVLTSVILSFALVISMQGYLYDSKFDFSFSVKPSVSGKYNAYVLYTDEIDKEVDWNNSSNVIKLENLFLSSDSFNNLQFKNLNRPYHLLYKFMLILESQSEIQNGTIFTVKDICVNSKKLEGFYETASVLGITYTEKCTANECKSHITDNFVLKANQNTAKLYQYYNLGVIPSFSNFVKTATIIAFLLCSCICYCLIRYLYNQKQIQSSRTSDLFFVVIISITIMIPILCIDTRPNIAEMNENRMLSNYQPLFTDDWHHPINLQWNRQFESYFDDRFGFRSYLVNIQKTLMTRFNSIVDVPNVGFCQKKNSWCFSRIDDELGGFLHRNNSFVNVDYVKKIALLTNKPIYILVYPIKTELYPEKVLIFKHPQSQLYSFSEYAMDQFKTLNLPNVHVINLLPILLKAKNNNPDKLLYFKDEHHATEYANKVVVDYLNTHVPEFMTHNKSKDIEKEYPSEILQIATDEFIGDKGAEGLLYGQTWGAVFGNNNRRKKIMFTKPEKYPFYSLSQKYLSDISFSQGRGWNETIIHNKNHSMFKVMIIGHSFVETLSKIVATSASDVYRMRVGELPNLPNGPDLISSGNIADQVIKLNPDVLIMAFWQGTFSYVN